jgi:hypothetical protein
MDYGKVQSTSHSKPAPNSTPVACFVSWMKNLVYKEARMGTHVNMFFYILIRFLFLVFSTTGFENSNMYIQDENLNYVQFL